MIKKILLLGILQCFIFGFSQTLRPVAQKISEYHAKNESFKKYDLFAVNKNSSKFPEYKRAATDISVLSVNSAELKKLVNDKPEYVEVSFPYNDKQITVELYKNQIFTSSFRVTTNTGEIVPYTPGVYYQGIVKGDNTSVVAFSFFDNDIIGVASTTELGNVIVGKVKNSEDFVSYSESKLTGANPFVCGIDELKENQAQKIAFDPSTVNKKTLTENCVRIYYEVCYTPYVNNGSNTTTVTNWLTAIHNNIATLYNNDDIKVALNEINIWTTQDPYSGTPNANLGSFRANRPTFNGDLAHLINAPATTSVAYLNSLCTSLRYAYSGISQTYSNVPVYSWTIQAMTHEMGHSLGSPHTHACAWNGNGTPIDGCGAQAGYSEGCTGPIPTSAQKGTIMSYCHLIGGVGIGFNNGFGPQPSALIRNTVDSKACLGTNCTTACSATITGMSVSNVTQNSANAVITDVISTSWKYKLARLNGTIITTGNTSVQNLSFTNLLPATYYKLFVGSSCSGSNAYQRSQIFLTDTDWCSDAQFADTGGDAANYGDNEMIVKTFYPSSGSALTMTFTQFALEQDYDFMNVYNGPSTTSPLFANGNNLTGNTLPGSFTSTDPSGAITVRFLSDEGVNESGWKANFSCAVLAVDAVNVKNSSINIYPNPARNMIVISSKENLKSYKIYDETGRLVSGSSLKGNKQEVNISSMQTGNYVVSIETDKQTVSKKLIKQ
ncbi:Por secretion system C-terminal sorting domain-containing protein [Chryseobacterium soldanellicola]|uniref:Por secretion system C-terminal sorting domain-containing protein n=1 Tax=Chryseobacterium soldanellicola TaxID=311333 RepID=A0A1H1G4Y3_9FLAO|nr:T9SS type A sorting domain-containing protein [Chryseobacterium soldanellicola]SDR08251.1 Por secretion system C-terminal sorting domain-containing protein [Chryseobacterium soldanellicola]